MAQTKPGFHLIVKPVLFTLTSICRFSLSTDVCRQRGPSSLSISWPGEGASDWKQREQGQPEQSKGENCETSASRSRKWVDKLDAGSSSRNSCSSRRRRREQLGVSPSGLQGQRGCYRTTPCWRKASRHFPTHPLIHAHTHTAQISRPSQKSWLSTHCWNFYMSTRK